MSALKLPKIFIFIKDGDIQAVTDEKGQIHDGAQIIDFDEMDNGICPVCYETVDFEQTSTCPKCGVDPDNVTFDQAIQALLRLEREGLPESVDIISSGYEWICPNCDTENRISGFPKEGKVLCAECGFSFKAAPPEHAYE